MAHDTTYITIGDAARILGICNETVRRYIARGILSGTQGAVSRQWRVDVDSVRRLLDMTDGEAQLRQAQR